MRVVVTNKVKKFLERLAQKNKTICKNNLKKLETPYPGEGTGDKEKLKISGEEIYRLHIARAYTAFYIIDKEQVVVLEIMSIERAHKKYGRL